MIGFISFALSAGFGRVFNYRSERPESNPVFLLVTIVLLVVSFFFPKFIDTRGLEVEDKQFETTYGVLYKKYRFWNN
jgi:hypothetical protein